jgi:hypothetical protein
MDAGRWVDAVITSVSHGGYANAVYGVKWTSGTSGGGEEGGVPVDRLARKRGFDYSARARAARAAKLTAARTAAGLKYTPGSFLARLHGESAQAAASAAAAAAAPLPTMAPVAPAEVAALVDKWLTVRGSGDAAAAERAAWLEAAVAVAAGLPDHRSLGEGEIHLRAPCQSLLRSLKPAATGSGAGSSGKGCAGGDGCRWKHVDATAWLSAWRAAVAAGEGAAAARALAAAMASAAATAAKAAETGVAGRSGEGGGGGGWRSRVAAAKGL